MIAPIANEERPCHFTQPFVRHDGAVFPCCRVWGDEQKKIAHLSDHDITEKMLTYKTTCNCLAYRFRPWQQADGEFIKALNIEFPMKCNARCAMCCVGAPFKQNESDEFCYDGIAALVDKFRPSSIASQGGEVLAQPVTLKFLNDIKKSFYDIKMHIVTNGSFDTNKADMCGEIFDSMTISIVGFQDVTYRAIMNLNLKTTRQFSEYIIGNTNIKVSLKYLCTPLNIHEIGIFIDWASGVCPNSIQIVSANFNQYINNRTSIPFWSQILKRSKAYMVNALVRNKQALNKNNIHVSIDQDIIDSFELSLQGFKKSGFETIELWY